MFAVLPDIFVRMVTGSRRKHLAWIKAILEATGWDQTRLAREARLDPSTISRFMREAVPGARLSANTIERIEALGIIPAFETAPPAKPRGFEENEASPFHSDGNGDPFNNAIAAAKNGRNGLDAWKLNNRSLELAGYLPGDVLMVDLNEEARTGDVVCAQLYLRDDRAETIMRIYEEPYLVAASADPLLRKPLTIGRDPVIIRGVVVTSIRPRQAGEPSAADARSGN